MNRRSNEEIEKMNKLFAEIGATEEAAPTALREAKILCERMQENTEFPFSQMCQKIIYPSEACAEKIASIRRKKGGDRLRSYRCDECHGFHLTSYIPRKS